MTGSGTQTDPYIVSEYKDFISAIKQSGIYIKCEKNVLWDMNNIDPTGDKYHNTEINVKCREIDGNGAIILNLCSKLNGEIFDIGGYNLIMKNLKFRNLRLTNNTRLIYSYTKSFNVNDCEFTGYLSNGSKILEILGSSSAYCTLHCRRNLFVLDVFSESWIIPNCNSYSNAKYDDCVFLINGNYTQADNTHYDAIAFYNCYFDGLFPMKAIRYQGDCNVINAGIQPNCDFSDVEALTVINSDKCEDINSLSLSSYIILATTEQLKDSVFLRNNNFPAPI